MRSRALSDAPGGRCRHDVGGITVNDSALAFVKALEIFDDDRLSDSERPYVMAHMLMPEGWAGRDMMDALDDVCWECFGIDVRGRRTPDNGPRALDWAKDAGRIRSSLKMAYGVDWDDIAGTTPFRDVADMLGGLMECGTDTPLQQAIHYRTARPPRRNKYNSEQVDAWLANREHYALDDGDDDPFGDEIFRRL